MDEGAESHDARLPAVLTILLIGVFAIAFPYSVVKMTPPLEPEETTENEDGGLPRPEGGPGNSTRHCQIKSPGSCRDQGTSLGAICAHEGHRDIDRAYGRGNQEAV